MAKSKVPAHIVQPTRKMTGEQIAEQRHFAHRSGFIPKKTKNGGRGNRSALKRAAIAGY